MLYIGNQLMQPSLNQTAQFAGCPYFVTDLAAYLLLSMVATAFAHGEEENV